MGKALEQTAGSKLQGILSTMTSSPIRGLLLGMAVTAVIQSSGATTVMAVGFVNSGLMELHQAISVIMGANIGTTVTGWLLSLSGLEGDSFLTKMMNPTAVSYTHLDVYKRQVERSETGERTMFAPAGQTTA